MMDFEQFIRSVAADLETQDVTIQRDTRGYVARWSRGDITVEILRTDERTEAGEAVVLVRLTAPGVSITPADYPMTLRGVRDVAVVVAAALDDPSAT